MVPTTFDIRRISTARRGTSRLLPRFYRGVPWLLGNLSIAYGVYDRLLSPIRQTANRPISNREVRRHAGATLRMLSWRLQEPDGGLILCIMPVVAPARV